MLPGLWKAVPGLESHAGTVVCEKTVTCAGTLRFVFGGAADTCRAWLDGRLLCEHTGAGAFDALLRDVAWGQHVLRLEVQCDRPGCGGLTGEVTIEQMGSAYVTAMKVDTHADGTAQVSVRVRNLLKKPQVADLECTVAGAEIAWKKRLLPPGGTITLRGEVRCDARPWSPEDPALHAAEAVLWLDGEPADDLRARVGFRDVQSGADFMPFPIPEAQDALRALQLAKASGAAGLRVSGAPDWLLDLCDLIGLPVWDEQPVCEGCHACVVHEGDAR